MFNFKNIIVPTDFSELSESSFAPALDIAKRYGAKIHLTYVLEKTPPFLAMRSLDVTEDEVMKNMEQNAKEQLEEMIKKFGDSEVEIIPVLRKGLDYEEIVAYSKEIQSELIVIATHGRTGIMHTLLGSVAQKVIRYAKCPVLVITPPEDQES
jgi:nucleotide-binding universal stress UspA family protein